MAPRPSGFTLLEVLVALLVITVGLLGLLGVLGPLAELASAGRAKGRIALVLESRMDQMRAELLRGAPACSPPASGTARHPDGVEERWSAIAGPGLVQLVIEAWVPAKRSARPDTLFSLLPCP